MFVAARCILETNYYAADVNASNKKVGIINSLEFELSNSREVSANFVKLADLKEKHTEHALFGSSVSDVMVYLIYPMTNIKQAYSTDCGSRLLEDGTLIGRIPPMSETQFHSKYAAETCGYLECHVAKERVTPTVMVVYRGDAEDYALEKAHIIKENFPHLTVEIL